MKITINPMIKKIIWLLPLVVLLLTNFHSQEGFGGIVPVFKDRSKPQKQKADTVKKPEEDVSKKPEEDGAKTSGTLTDAAYKGGAATLAAGIMATGLAKLFQQYWQPTQEQPTQEQPTQEQPTQEQPAQQMQELKDKYNTSSQGQNKKAIDVQELLKIKQDEKFWHNILSARGQVRAGDLSAHIRLNQILQANFSPLINNILDEAIEQLEPVWQYAPTSKILNKAIEQLEPVWQYVPTHWFGSSEE